ARERGVEVRLRPLDDGDDGAVRAPEVLHVDLVLGPAVGDGEDEPAAVLGHVGRHPLLAAEAGAERLDVGIDRRAQRVMADADAARAVLAGVVEAGAVAVPRHAAVQVACQDVGQVAAGVDVAHAQLRFVLAAAADEVDDAPAVAREILEAHARRAVGAERVRIAEHPPLPPQPAADVEDRELVVRSSPGGEVTAAALEWAGHRVDARQRGEAREDPGATRERVEERVGIGVLRVDERARLGAPLVLEPAIGIDDGDAVERLDHVVLARGRVRRRRGRPGPARAGRPAGEGDGEAGRHRRNDMPIASRRILRPWRTTRSRRRAPTPRRRRGADMIVRRTFRPHKIIPYIWAEVTFTLVVAVCVYVLAGAGG